jgi:hypothetical protein
MKFFYLIATTLIALASYGANAQQVTLYLEGQVNSTVNVSGNPGAAGSVSRIQASFTYDLSSPSYVITSSGWREFKDVLVTAEYTLLDAQGQPVTLNVPDLYTVDEGYTTNDTIFCVPEDGTGCPYSYSWFNGNTAGKTTYYVFDELTPYSDISNFPFYVTSDEAEISVSGRIYLAQAPNVVEFNVLFDTILYDGLDDDGDGIADGVDNCEASLLEETVLFDGWHDSGVTNYVDESGCSVMDHYAACEVEQEEQEFSRFNLRSFYSGPSYCEKQVAYDLVSDGLIDFSEARALRDALYHASRSNGPR